MLRVFKRLRAWWRDRRKIAGERAGGRGWGGDRFVVEREASSGRVFHLYSGNDGVKAVEAWEAYRADSIAGTFRMRDAEHPAGHRGTFTRLS